MYAFRSCVFAELRENMGRRVKRVFNQRMAEFGLFGKPRFDHGERTLELTIAHLVCISLVK